MTLGSLIARAVVAAVSVAVVAAAASIGGSIGLIGLWVRRMTGRRVDGEAFVP